MRTPTLRQLLWIAFVAVAYYGCARLGLLVAFEGFNGSAVWPASGVALAALVLLGPGVAPGILIGAVAANLVVQLQLDGGRWPSALTSSILIGLGNTFEALVAMLLLRRLGLRQNLFDSVRAYMCFVGTTLVACLATSAAGAAVLGSCGSSNWSTLPMEWLTWFIGDAVGILIVTPVIVAWARRRHDDRPNPHFAEGVILFAALVTTAYLVFVQPLSSAARHTLPYALIPLLLLAAFRQPLLETAAAVLLVSAFAVWGTVEGHGPFAGDSTNAALVMYQAFSGIVTITILTLKAALIELRTSEARFNSLFRSHLIGVTLSDAQQRIVVANPAFLRMTGYGPDDLPLEWTELRPRSGEGSRSRYLETGSYLAREQEIIHRQGHIVPVMVGSAVIDRSMPHRVISIVLDLSARRHAAQQHEQLQEQLRQAQKLEAVGTLATGVAHDFNNIITAILGYTHALRAHARGNAQASEALDGIVEISTQASEVTRSLLTFSRQVPAQRKPIAVGDVVQESVRMLQRALPAAIHVDCVLPDRPLWILADATQLSQVLLNLAVNSRDAMPHGGELRIRVEHRRLHDAVVLIVEDTGTGMSADVRQRVFEPFFTTKAREQGTGLGLATVLGIIKDHDGRIDIDSAPGAGCRMTLSFPACDPPTDAPRSARGAAASPRGHGTALVVEDNDQVRAVIVHALRETGFEVMEAADGRDAAELFMKHAPAIRLAIIDIDLPRKSGAECIMEFKTTAPQMRIIAISGNLDAQGSVPSGTAFLHKPFGMSELCMLAGRLMNGDAAMGES